MVNTVAASHILHKLLLQFHIHCTLFLAGNSTMSFDANQVLYVCFQFIIAWIACWYAIYLVTGFHLRSIGINNGVLFNRVSFTSKSIRISIGSVRFRLWGNSRMLILDEVDIQLRESRKKRKPKGRKHDTDTPEDNDILGHPCIFPKNVLLRNLLKLLIKLIPNIDLEIRHATIHDKKELVSKAEYIRATIKSQKAAHNRIFSSVINTNNIDWRPNNSDDTNEEALLSLATLKLQSGLLVNLRTGELFDVQSKLFTDEFKVRAFSLARWVAQNRSSKNESDEDTAPATNSEGQPKSIIRLVKWHSYIYRCMHEISLIAENTMILEFPFLSADDDYDMSKFWDQPDHNHYFNFQIKSLSHTIRKFDKDSAGFHVLFDPKVDSPVQAVTALQILRVEFCRKVKNTHNQFHVSEIISIPNCSVTHKGNMSDHFVKGDGFKNCAIELFASLSNPTLDLDADQLSIITYNFIAFKKFMKAKKLMRKDDIDADQQSDDTNDPDDTKVEALEEELNTLQDEHLHEEHLLNDQNNKANHKANDVRYRANIIGLLNEYYPRLNMTLIMEQPRIVIRQTDKNHNCLKLVNFSYSLLNIHVLTTDQRDYDARCHILHPAITYQSQTNDFNSSTTKHEIFLSEALTCRLQVLKSFEVKADFEVAQTCVEMGKLSLLAGISSLMDDLRKSITQCLQSSKILEQIEKIGNDRARNQQKSLTAQPSVLFHPLPHWLLELNFELSNIKLNLGSRSLLIPENRMTSISNDIVNEDIFGDYNHLQSTSFSVGKVRFQYLNGTDIETTTAMTLPASSLETLAEKRVELWSLNSRVSDISMSMDLDVRNPKLHVLSVPDIDLKVSALQKSSNLTLQVEITVEKVSLSYDKFKLFTLLGTVGLFKLLLLPFRAMKERISDKSRDKFDDSTPETTPPAVEFDCLVKSLDLVLELSEECTVKTQLFDAQLSSRAEKHHVFLKLLRVMLNSPTVPNAWSRVLCVDSLNVDIDPKLQDPITVDTDFIKLIQPHGLVVYHLFDSMSITIKVLKHLVACLKSNADKSRFVAPSESKAKKIPKVRLKSFKVHYQMEDDPFESELNMSYQLGMVEQRKRLEELSLFDVSWKRKHGNEEGEESGSNEEYEQLLNKLRSQMARSWVRKVKVYRAKLKEEIAANKRFIFGSECKLDTHWNEGIVPYLYHAPLLNMMLLEMDLDLSSVEDLEKVPEMIHSLGQGVPVDTRYSLLLPLFVKLHVLEVRMHLRDYPLPMLHIPRSDDRKVLGMQGNFIISEAFITNKENLRRMQVPLSKVLKDTKSEDFYSLCIDKSLSTVKLYSDMKFKILPSDPARFVWGQSYQFGIQQIMLNMDQFSKPPVDPSPKLGFWDKLRLIFHGKFEVTSDTGSGLEIAFKGSRDPYNLFGDGCGFVLAFNDELHWKINKDDDPRHFFEVHAKKVSWYIPNYMKAPLVAWSRDISKSNYLPDSTSVITSCFAYYLQESKPKSASHKANIIEKHVVRLSGGIDFKVGFMLERKDEKGERTFDCKPHYDVNLFNPIYTKEGHDSYAGFRSDYIHMSIGLEANSKKSTNAIYLSPNTFQQFFRWWKLFQSNMILPVRRGPMFGELKQSVKFSQHLMTNKFQFHVKSLFITHVYRDSSDIDNDKMLCVGLKAKVEEFVVDLHLRKEQRTIVHEALSRDQKTMKMNFNIGEVHLNGIDLRLLKGEFDYDVYNPEIRGDREMNFASYDKDKSWLDARDFVEVHSPSVKSGGDVKIFPLMHSKRFTYLRDTMDENDDNEFGNEDIHECYLDTSDQLSPAEELLHERITDLKKQVTKCDSKHLEERIDFIEKEFGKKRSNSVVSQTSIGKKNSDEEFHNKFALVGMFLKWNVDSRNNLMKYIHYSQLKSMMAKYLSYESISTLEELQEEAEKMINDDKSSGFSDKDHNKLSHLMSRPRNLVLKEEQTAEARLDSFSKILKSCSDGENITEDFKIEIISPQIQMLTETNPDAVVLVTAPKIDIQIVSVVEENSDKLIINPKEYVYRYGVVLHEANFFVIRKEDAEKPNELALSSKAYGSKTNWPPWLGIEISQQGRLAGTKKLLIEKMSLMLMYDQIRPLGKKLYQTEDSSNQLEALKDGEQEHSFTVDKLCVDIPQVVITSTSQQYFTLYVIVLGLFFYSEPMSKSLSERLEKLKFSIDFQDLGALHSKLTQLHNYYQLMGYLLRNYEFRQDNLDNDTLNDGLTLRSTQDEVAKEVYSLMLILLSGDFNSSSLSSKANAEWFIRTDQIILHMLEDDGASILDLAMAKSNYRRLVFEDDSNINNIDIEMMQGFNLIKNAHYPAFIEPLEEITDGKQSLVNVRWKMNRPIGGIRIMEEFEINSQPLNVKLDEVTGDKLMKYIFQSDLSDLKESPILQKQKEGKEDGDEDSNDGPGNADSDSGELDSAGKKQSDSSDHSSSSESKNKKIQLLTSSHSEYEFHDQVDDMVSRSKQYLSIIDFKLNSFKALISFKYKTGIKRLLNVQNFIISFPELVIHRKVMSLLDIAMMVKKIVLKSVIMHSGSLIKNKLTVQHQPKRVIKAPLKPIKRYVRFTKISELHLESHESLET